MNRRSCFAIFFLLTLGEAKDGQHEPYRIFENKKNQPMFKNFNLGEGKFSVTSVLLSYLQRSFFSSIEDEITIAFKKGITPNISSKCLSSLHELQSGLMETKLWAVQMMDSYGHFPSGILGGTFQSYGDYDMCVDIQLPGKFQGQYCTVQISRPVNAVTDKVVEPQDLSFVYHPDMNKPLTSYFAGGSSMGGYVETSLCLPSTCIKEEIRHILSKVLKVAALDESVLKISMKDCLVKTDVKLTAREISLLALILMFVILEVIATIFDVQLRRRPDEDTYKSNISMALKCLLCFSFYTNVIRLFKKVDNTKDTIKIFHGIKFLTMVWIISCHTLLMTFLGTSKKFYTFKMHDDFFLQILVNGFPAVETFFFISGALVVYGYLKSNSQQINFIYYVLYRYYRLIPPVMLCIAWVFLLDLFKSGPRWNELMEPQVKACEMGWWKNLLFINNYVYRINNVEANCAAWTWYVAVDFQLYVLAYFLLLLLTKNPAKTMQIIIFVIVTNVFFLAAFYAYFKLPPVVSLLHLDYRKLYFYVKMCHFYTHNHITPYGIGMITGYIIATKKKFCLPWNIKFCCWTFSFVFGVITVFSSYLWTEARVPSLPASILYGCSHRLLWSLMLAWITYSCMTGEGGVITNILSRDEFVPLGRLTFMAFLVHPIVELVVFGRMRGLLYPSYITLIYMCLFFVIASYSCAFVSSLFCESPLSGLLSLIISSNAGKSGSKRKKESLTV